MVLIEEVVEEAAPPKAPAAETKKTTSSSSSKPKNDKATKNNNKDDDKSKADKYNELMNNMSKAKEKWDAEDNDGTVDEQDRLLSQAIEMAIEQGRGWSEGEKEEYLEKILDDDFIPPMFASTPEEVEKSGLGEAFTSLIYDGESPTSLMLQFRKKGNDAFADGKRNQVNNLQFYRDAINHYYEALAWANKIEPLQEGDLAQADTDDPTYTKEELDEQKSAICSNIALMHMQIKNWGYARDEAKRATAFNDKNVKAWFRLAKSYEMLKQWEAAGDAIDAGLQTTTTGEANKNADLLQLQRRLDAHIRRARKLRQERAAKRAVRVSQVKAVWKHATQELGVTLGRTSLVASVTDDEDDDDDEVEEESRWHQHLPNSGVLPLRNSQREWSWPCMFLYPSHKQSDFIREFPEQDMLAIHMAQMFPELEDTNGETPMPWDVNNEFACSQLAVYFEVHHHQSDKSDKKAVIHPDSVEILHDQGSCMKFYESSRALKGDEGPEMANVVRAVERKHLYQQRKKWKQEHGSLWAKPDPAPVVRVHPAMTLKDVLQDERLVVPNFIVTFVLIPEQHPAHEAFLKEHKCLGVLQPDFSEQS